VFLHGAGDQAGTWASTAKALISEYTLILPDLAGHGESEPVEGPIEASQIYQALESLLEQEAAGRPVTLIGNSLGAWMATLLAQRHPEWVARVVPVNGGPLLGTSTAVKLLPATREEARQAVVGLRDPSSPTLPDYVLDDIVRRAKISPLARFAATALTMGPWLLTEDQLRGIHVPMRLVWGVADQLMPLDYAQRMIDALPDARLIPVERCGHVPQQEAPDRFLAALRKALEA
jgi:pimeloyl-ACP methyl ester carboxylesterase